MIPARFAPIVFALSVSMVMSAIISGVSMASAMGLTADLPGLWLWAWLKSWAVAFPTLLVVAPLGRRMVAKLVQKPG